MTATTNEQKRNIKIWKWVCMVAYHFALIMLFFIYLLSMWLPLWKVYKKSDKIFGGFIAVA